MPSTAPPRVSTEPYTVNYEPVDTRGLLIEEGFRGSPIGRRCGADGMPNDKQFLRGPKASFSNAVSDAVDLDLYFG